MKKFMLFQHQPFKKGFNSSFTRNNLIKANFGGKLDQLKESDTKH
jgi:hypothetical protein